MIAINKAEAEAIREKFPNTHIVRTMKHKSKRHRYYCEESRSVVRFLDSFRGGRQTFVAKEGGSYTNRKKNKRIPARLS